MINDDAKYIIGLINSWWSGITNSKKKFCGRYKKLDLLILFKYSRCFSSNKINIAAQNSACYILHIDTFETYMEKDPI